MMVAKLRKSCDLTFYFYFFSSPKKVTKKARLIFYALKFWRPCLIMRIATVSLGNAPLASAIQRLEFLYGIKK
jgi:hypothetical protein